MYARTFCYVALAVLLLATRPYIARAQFATGADPFTLSVSPQFPTPGGQATITPISGQVDVTSATMTISVNGTQVYSGDATAVAITLGAAGTTAKIVVRLTASVGSYSQSVSITPEDVSLVLEPLSSAPPLYQGKPLVPTNGSVRLVAIADLRTAAGKRLAPASLSYRWTIDGVQSQSSGIGKQTLIVDSPLPYRDRTVSVQVVSPDGTLSGADSIDFSAADPTLRVYERDPLLGVRFDRALSSYTLLGSEATLYAAPYSFPTALGAPSIAWFLNGVSAQLGNFITLRPTGSTSGNATLSATAASGDLTNAVSLPVTFGGSGSSSFFSP